MDYKYILKQEGITIKEFASRLHVSRPTLYKLMDLYNKGVGLDEPYESIFDAFFLKERNNMKGNYQSRNGNLVVKILDNTAENANGTFIKGSETRGKRDIVMAQVLVGDSNVPENTIIYFSYYAGQPFTLEGEEVFIVNKLDIKFIKKGENVK